MPKVTGTAKGNVKGYAVWREADGKWLSVRTDAHHKHELERWVDKRESATWFMSIDNALKAVRQCGISLGGVHVLPMRDRTR